MEEINPYQVYVGITSECIYSQLTDFLEENPNYEEFEFYDNSEGSHPT